MHCRKIADLARVFNKGAECHEYNSRELSILQMKCGSRNIYQPCESADLRTKNIGT